MKREREAFQEEGRAGTRPWDRKSLGVLLEKRGKRPL